MIDIGKFQSILLVLFWQILSCTNGQSDSGFKVTLSSDQGIVGLVNGTWTNSTFVWNDLCCSSNLYNLSWSIQNASAYLLLSGYSEQRYVKITAEYDNIDLVYYPHICPPSGCQIQITSQCSLPSSQANYFDRILIDIDDYSTQLSYYLLCDSNLEGNPFQWGLVIEIVVITLLLYWVAIYSMAWSFGGHSIEYNFWWAIIFTGVYIGVLLVQKFSSEGVSTDCITVISFVLGVLGVAICSNELLYLLRLRVLSWVIFKRNGFEFRLMQVFSLLIGGGMLIGWYYSSNNMIIDDVICVCMAIGFIKTIKFASLKIAGLTILLTIGVQFIFQLVMFKEGQNYNSSFIDKFDSPLFLQIPVLTRYPVFDQKCAWIPFNSILYTGMLFCYLHRFDSSRSTKLYLIICALTYSIGGLVYSFISIHNDFTVPVGFVTEPCMFILIWVFSYRRHQFWLLWDGEFCEQYANGQDLRVLAERIRSEKRSTDLPVRGELMIELLSMSRGGEISQFSDSSEMYSVYLRNKTNFTI